MFWIVLEVRHALRLHESPQMLSEAVLGSEGSRKRSGIHLLARVSGNTEPVNAIVVEPFWTLAMVRPQLKSPVVKEFVGQILESLRVGDLVVGVVVCR